MSSGPAPVDPDILVPSLFEREELFRTKAAKEYTPDEVGAVSRAMISEQIFCITLSIAGPFAIWRLTKNLSKALNGWGAADEEPSALAGPRRSSRTQQVESSGSRWEEPSSETEMRTSTWERVRQSNARKLYPKIAGQTVAGSPPQYSTQLRPESPPDHAQEYSRQYGDLRVKDYSNEDRFRHSLPGSSGPLNMDNVASKSFHDPARRSAQQQEESGRFTAFSVVEGREQQSKGLQGFEIESDAPIQVAKGSLLAALVGGVSGATYGVLKGNQGLGAVFAARMGFQFFAFAFPFFATREYLISPIINRTSSGPDPEHRHMRLKATPNKHTDKLAASGISGAVAGAGYAAYGKGLQAAPKGGLTFGVLCIGLQLAGNEARNARNSILRPYRPSPAPPAAAAMSSQREVVPTLAMSDVQTPVTADASRQQLDKSGADLVKDKEKQTSTLMSKLESVMPFRKLSDEEYEATLDDRLKKIHERIADIEAEISDIEAKEVENAST